jgi:hypothetical protein
VVKNEFYIYEEAISLKFRFTISEKRFRTLLEQRGGSFSVNL